MTGEEREYYKDMHKTSKKDQKNDVQGKNTQFFVKDCKVEMGGTNGRVSRMAGRDEAYLV